CEGSHARRWEPRGGPGVGTRKGCRRYKWELKDSNKEFWSMGHAVVKILSLGCLIGSLIMFTGSIVHPLLTLIITMEISIFSFLFVIYTFAINRYLPFVLWPIADILNDLFACIFLGGAVAFAVQTRQSIPMNYLIALVSLPCSAVYLLRSHLFWRMVLFPCFAERASYLFTKCWDPSKV
uniref:MARVEL domain-containing protein n=1 Tax=Equus asinus asinus TaxID=83772 RepID=A0A8C4LR16_EQUAS